MQNSPVDPEKGPDTHLDCSGSAIKESLEKERSDEELVVKFAEPYDEDNPLDWPRRKKWLVTGVLSATGLNRITVSTIMAPALPVMAAELHMNSTESVMALSVYLLATAFGPLLIGPFSEIYGREVVLHATNIWFAVWNLVCGFAHNKQLLIAARFLAGFGASAIYTLAAGVMGDMWRPEERGRSLGAYILVPLLGAAIGPIIGGFITEYTTWRWMFWSTSILQASMILGSFFLYDESYAPVILQRKAQKLRKQTGDSRYHTVGAAEEIGKSPLWVMQRHLTRPFRLLMFHPIIQIQALLSGFSYGITYLVLATFSDLWTTQYHEAIAISGLHYISMCLGEVIGAQIGGRLIDFVYRKMTASGRTVTPESRMLVMLPTAILVPAGLLIYGWAAQTHQFWLVVDLGACLQALGLTMGGQAIQAYVIDSYPKHTGSAAAASQFLRSLAAFGFPLFAPRMYKVLGYGWGNTLLAFVSIGVLIPSPLLLWKYGPKLRERAASSH